MSRRRALLNQLHPTLVAAAAVLLTMVALAPTLTGGPWFLKALTAIVTVAVVGAAGRTLSLPGWAVVITQGIAIAFLITLIFAGDAARFGVLPGPETWRTFADLARDGITVINQEVAPVTATAGMQFLVVVGVASVAWAVDAIAVTGRRATLASIPLLALYLVPATVLPHGVPWQLFLAAGVGWLLLLVEDGHIELARWGRPIDGSADIRVPSIGGTGRRLGAAALTVALIVPLILPTLDDGRFGGGSTDGNGNEGDGDTSPGAQRVVTINPLTDLQRDLTQRDDSAVLFYTTDATTPQYLRIATLDEFNGQTWTLEELEAGSDQQATRGLPPPPGLSDQIARTEVTYDFTVGALDTPRLPLPYPVSVVSIDGDWRWDEQTLDVFSADENGSAFSEEYSATALQITPTVAQLQAAPPADPSTDTALYPWMDLLPAVRDRITPLAESVTADATTDYDRALTLQNWFRTEFDYSLDTVQGNASEALDDFLRDRSGYCEQFAATMALMARALDIPSRVQVGFTPGELAEDGTWLVTVHDAHAWPELWFDGVGWVRFEPTPGGGDGGGVPGYAPVPQVNDPGKHDTSNNKGSTVVLRRGGEQIGKQGGRPSALREVLNANRSGPGAGTSPTAGGADDGNSSTILLWLFLLAVAAAIAAAPKAAALAVGRLRWRRVDGFGSAALAAWADVLDVATDVDLRPAATETTRDLAARVVASGGLTTDGKKHVRQLASWVELFRYRGSVSQPPSSAEVRQLAQAVRTDLLGALSARDRRLATWFPMSGRIALMGGWNEAAEWVAGRGRIRTMRRPSQAEN